jgi:hypothetical protein
MALFFKGRLKSKKEWRKDSKYHKLIIRRSKVKILEKILL